MTSTVGLSPLALDPFGHEQPFAPSSEGTQETQFSGIGAEGWETPYAEASPTHLSPGRGEFKVDRYAPLAKHRGTTPDLVLRWNNVTAAGPVDVVVHFHGYSGAGERMRIDTEKLPDSGLDFSDPRSGTAGRARPTLAILPRGNFFGGTYGNAYNFPALIRPGVVDRLIADGLALLGQKTGLAVTRGRLILTGHSGGGAPLTAVVEAVDPEEVEVFDGLYGSGAAIGRWARSRIGREIASPGAIPPAMRIVYRPGSRKHPGTQPQSEALARQICSILQAPGAGRLASRFRVDRTTVAHMDLPRRFGWALLADASAALQGPVTLRCATAKTNEIGEQPQAESLDSNESTAEAVERFESDVAREEAPFTSAAEMQPETLERGSEQPENLAWETPSPGSESEDAPAAGRWEETGEQERESSWAETREQVQFREAVLAAHLARSRQRKSRGPGRDLAPDELGPVAGTDLKMRADAAIAAGRLIAAANEALRRARERGEADALLTTRVSAASGYRGREHQATLWRRYFPGYYRRTQQSREALPGGPHGDAAVRYMIDVFGLPNWIAAPGYSNHQAGIAIDLLQKRRPGAEIKNSGNSTQLAKWRRSWLFAWLGDLQNAASFGFQPYKKEPWHWEFRGPSTSRLSEEADSIGEAFDPASESFDREGSAISEATEADQRVGESLDPAGERFDPEGSAITEATEADQRVGESWSETLDENEEAGEEFGEAEGLDEFEEPSRWTEATVAGREGESEGPSAIGAESSGEDLDQEAEALLEAEDLDYFEARADALGFDPGREQAGESEGETTANDPPTRTARPPWPGRRLRLTKRPYMHGVDVRAWQRRMIERQWTSALGRPFKDDGIFGPQTTVVTTRFQQVQGLPVTGVVDAITWAAGWITGARTAPVTGPAVFYDRAAAFNYARTHWNVVCSDGFVAGTFGPVAFKSAPAATKFINDGNGTEHARLPDGTTIPWSDLDDCTHFISCCIGQPPGGTAGGLPLPGQLGTSPKAPYGVVRVSSLVEFLTKRKWVVLEGERSKDVSLIGRLQRGDLVAYFNETRGRYTHMALYLGNGKIACHTYCRFDHSIDAACTWDDDWDLGAGTKTFTWTFLRFVV